MGTKLYLNGGSVITNGSQAYNDVTLGADTALSGTTITFNGIVAGGTHSLDITGNAVFGDAGGDTVTGLSKLQVSGTTLINSSTVISSGVQTYNDAVTLGGDTSLLGTTTTFNGTVAGGTHSLDITGNAVFGDAGGDIVTGLSKLQVSGTTLINSSTISSSGVQTYNDAVTLGGDTSLFGTTTTFNGTVAGGTHSLDITGNAVFGDAGGDTVTGLSKLQAVSYTHLTLPTKRIV